MNGGSQAETSRKRKADDSSVLLLHPKVLVVPDTDDRSFREKHQLLQKETEELQRARIISETDQIQTRMAHDSLFETNTLTQTRVRELEKTAQAREDEIARLLSTHSQKEASLQKRNTELEAKIQEQDVSITALQTKTVQLQLAGSQCQGERATSKQTIEHLMQALNDSTAEKDQAQIEHDNTVDLLKEDLEVLKSQNENLQNRLQLAEESKEKDNELALVSLERVNDEKKALEVKAAEQVGDLTSKIDRLQEKCNELELQNDQLKSQSSSYDDITAKLKELRQEHQALQQKAHDSDKDLKTTIAEKKVLEVKAEQVGDLTSKIDQLQEKCDELQLQNNQLKSRSSSYDDIATKLEKLRQEHQALQQKAHNSDKDLKTTTAEKEALEVKAEQVGDLTSKIDRLQEKCDELQLQNNQLKSRSSSYDDIAMKLEKLRQEHQALQQKAHNSDKDLKMTTAEKKALEVKAAEQAGDLTSKIREVQANLTETQERCNKLESANKALSVFAETVTVEASSEKQALVAEKQALVAEKQALLAEKQMLEITGAELNKKLKSLQEIQTQLLSAEEKLRQSQQQELQANQTASKHRSVAKDLEEENLALVATTTSLKKQLEQLQKHSIQASTVPLNGIITHDFSAVKGMGLTLSGAPVSAELRHSGVKKTSYKLGEVITSSQRNTSSRRPLDPSPSDQPWKNYKASPYQRRRKRAHSTSEEYTFTPSDESESEYSSTGERRRKANRKGKKKARDYVTSESSDDTLSYSAESDEESNVSSVAKKWEGKKEQWKNGATRRKTANKLARDLIHQALHIRHNYEGFARDGVTKERLQNFEDNPIQFGPKLRNTRLDKRGLSTRTLMKSRWNQALIYILAKEARSISSASGDKQLTREIDWSKLFYDRVYRIILREVRSRPLENEGHEARLLRLAAEHDDTSKKNTETGIRHTKYHTRSEIACIMIQISRQRQEAAGQAFWTYVLQILHKLRHDGMSDEEDANQVVERAGIREVEPIKRVLVLGFRNAYFRELFEQVDKTKGLEEKIFHKGGRTAMKRIRVDAVSDRQPPKGLPRNFLSDEFLKDKLQHEVDALCLKKDFPLREFANESLV